MHDDVISSRDVISFKKNTDVIKCVLVSDYWNDCIDDILFYVTC